MYVTEEQDKCQQAITASVEQGKQK